MAGIAAAVIFGLIVLGVLVSLAGGGGDEEQASGRDAQEEDLFPNRPDEKDGDKERNIGEEARLSGYTATVTAASFQPQLNEFEQDGYLVADVTLVNRDDRAQPYNTFDWKLITPGGTIIDPYPGGEQLGAGDLVAGGSISGQLIWEVGAEKGDYYIIYDPADFGEDRGVWRVTL